VEIGYGLAPSARGHDYAAEAVAGLLTVAVEHGLTKVIAETTLDNVASQRTLIRAGFHHVGTDTEVHHYESGTRIAPSHSRLWATPGFSRHSHLTLTTG